MSVAARPLPKKVPFSLSMLGWALNEEESVAEYIERAESCLSAVTDDFELILIDDGSTDATWHVAQKCQSTRPWLRLYKNDRNRGPGYNTKRAIGLARKDYLFWQTVDWSYDIRDLLDSLDLLAKYEVLQGVRVAPISPFGIMAERSDHFGKAVVSLTNYYLLRLLFRLPLRDYQNVTVYPRHLIQSVELETESSFTNPECLFKVWARGRGPSWPRSGTSSIGGRAGSYSGAGKIGEGAESSLGMNCRDRSSGARPPRHTSSARLDDRLRLAPHSALHNGELGPGRPVVLGHRQNGVLDPRGIRCTTRS
jgi:hypothetical protein